MLTLRCIGALFLAASYLVSAPTTVGHLISSTYLKASFTPVAITTDATGNVYIAGNALLDSVTGREGVLVVKLNPQGTQYLYETYINGSTAESAGGIVVDSAGNAYIAGTTRSSDFPVTPGGALTAPSTSPDDSRPFVVRLDAHGIITFSCIFGGQGGVNTLAIAADGNILVSGGSTQQGFPSTPGAFSVPNTTGRPYLLKLDPKTPKILFAATGIGGNSIALDSAGTIYVSGLTSQTDYPTTPGAYQTKFSQGFTCSYPLCQLGFPAPLQYITKIDPTGSKLIYSTGLNPPVGDTVAFAGPNVNVISNNGIVVDAVGNAYVTGVTMFPDYPYTTPPAPHPRELTPTPFLSKLDPTGSKLLFSVPAGGSSLQFDTSNHLYVGGILYGPVTSAAATDAMVGLPANFPERCLPNNITSTSEGYLQQIDPSTGAVNAVQFIDGSVVTSGAISIPSQGTLWMTGAVSRPDIPFTPGSPFPIGLGPQFEQLGRLRPEFQPGAYLASISFSETAPSIQIACVLDAATMMHTGVVGPDQLLSILGMNLGPGNGVNAPAGGATSLAGVTITIGDVPAKLLYASSSQINVAVPGVSHFGFPFGELPSAVMQVKVNSASADLRLFPVTLSNPSLFTDLFATQPPCVSGHPPTVLARNADGSINSCDNPSKPGAELSLYLQGVGDGRLDEGGGVFVSFDWIVVIGGISAEVINVSKENEWVTRVDVRLPAALRSFAIVTMRESSLPVGPLSLTDVLAGAPTGDSLPLAIWIEP